jgi:4-alpha-glucanotransferase
LEDALGVVEQVNLPGTIDEHPNWRRRLAVPLEELLQASTLRSVGSIMEPAGRTSGGQAQWVTLPL